MKIFRNSVLLLFLIMLNSCVTIHTGIPTTSGVLSGPNFKYVKTNVSGLSTSFYILGIGGNMHSGMIAEAKEDLMIKYPLGNNQALVNVIVDFKVSHIPGDFLIKEYTCLYTADIVEFIESPQTIKKEIDKSIQKQEKAGASNENESNNHEGELKKTKKKESAISPETNAPNFLFENLITRDKYYVNSDFLKEVSKVQNQHSYKEAQMFINSFYQTTFSSFLPTIDELKLLYDSKKLNTLKLTIGLYWSSDVEGDKVKCFNFSTGKIELKAVLEDAYFVPLYILK